MAEHSGPKANLCLWTLIYHQFLGSQMSPRTIRMLIQFPELLKSLLFARIILKYQQNVSRRSKIMIPNYGRADKEEMRSDGGIGSN